MATLAELNVKIHTLRLRAHSLCVESPEHAEAIRLGWQEIVDDYRINGGAPHQILTDLEDHVWEWSDRIAQHWLANLLH